VAAAALLLALSGCAPTEHAPRILSRPADEIPLYALFELSLTNVSGYLVNVEARFFEENRNNIILFVPVKEFQLASGQTLTVKDVLAEWFPNKRETKGYLLITAEPPGATEQPVAIAVTVRVFNNADPSATYYITTRGHWNTEQIQNLHPFACAIAKQLISVASIFFSSLRSPIRGPTAWITPL